MKAGDTVVILDNCKHAHLRGRTGVLTFIDVRNWHWVELPGQRWDVAVSADEVQSLEADR